MSQPRFYEKNTGPLKLDHDIPRGYYKVPIETRTGPANKPYEVDFRNRGYHNTGFESPRIPASQTLEVLKQKVNANAQNLAEQSLDDLVPRGYYKIPIETRTGPAYYQVDFRNRGYHNTGFESPRFPVSQSIEVLKQKVKANAETFDEQSSNNFAPSQDYHSPRPPYAQYNRTHDFRYRGYPSQSFVSPRIPASHMIEEAKRDEKNLDVYYGKQSLFDPVKPKVYEGNRGMQYGSREQRHTPPPAPKPTRIPDSLRAVPFGEDKTPAEIEKRRQYQRDAEEDIQRFKDQQNHRKQREMEEKKRNDGDYKRRKFQEEDTPRENPKYRDMSQNKPEVKVTPPADSYKQDELNRQTNQRPNDKWTGRGEDNHPDFFLNEFKQPKRGQENHNLQGNEAIRFQEDSRKSIENRFRYNKPQQEKDELRQALEKQRDERELRVQDDRLLQLRREIEDLKHNSYGKPGAGAPNRSQSGSVIVRKKMFFSNDLVEQRKIRSKEELFTRREFQDPRKEEMKSLDLYGGLGGAGAPMFDTRGKTITRLPITMKRDDMGVSTLKEHIPAAAHFRKDYEPEEADYSPFGRAGAGAPIRDSEGRIITNIYGKMKGDSTSADRRRKTRAAHAYRNDLQQEMEEQRRNREDMENHVKAPIGELSTIMDKYIVGKPKRDPITGTLVNQALPTSDISKQMMNRDTSVTVEKKKEYYNDLSRQAEERKRSQKLDKLRETQESKHHYDVSGDMFGSGRRGGGAPNGPNAKKQSLEQILFSPRRDAPDWMYQTPRQDQQKPYQSRSDEDYSSSNVTQRYLKSNVPSKHSNMYEMSDKGPSDPYSTRPPYAFAYGY